MKIPLFIVFCCSVYWGRAQDTLVADSLINPYQVVSDSAFLHSYVVEDTSKYTFEMIGADIDFFAQYWPENVSLFTVGTSEFGLPLRGFKISKGSEEKNAVLLVGNIHAREDFSSKLVMKFANVFLLSLEGKSSIYPHAASLLDAVDVYVIPVANPDGLKIAHEDVSGIEDSVVCWIDSIYCVESLREWKANGKGVDLNCSFDDGNWAVKKGGAFQECMASEGYKGTKPAEPKETQCLQAFVTDLKPLTTLSFHTKGNILFWADTKTHPLFEGIDTEMAGEVARKTVFRTGSIAKYGSDYGCGLENYVRARLGSIGVCVELADGDGGRTPHPDALFNEQVWLRAWEIPILYLENTVEHREHLQRIQAQFLGARSNQ